MALDFEALSEADEIAREFGTDGADWSPVCGKLLRDALDVGIVGDAEYQGHGVAVFGVDAGVCIAIFEGPIFVRYEA